LGQNKPTSRFAKKTLLLGAVLIILLWDVVSIFIYSTVSAPVYSATNDSLNLAIVDGITRTERSPSADTYATGKVRAVIVPHHLVASQTIAMGVKALASSAPRVIVLISPDHFGRCSKLLCTTKGSFKTFFGDISVSNGDVKNLLLQNDIIDGSDLFAQEHGIYAIVPFIRHYLPEATVIPIAVSQRGTGTEESRAQALALISTLLNRKDIALVISSDFSHYLPLPQAQQMDLQTTLSFCSGDTEEILRLQNPAQNDCPLCLWILAKEAQTGGFWNPVLIAHTNSATLLGDASVSQTTSHFAFLFPTIPTPNRCYKGDIEQPPLPLNLTATPNVPLLAVGDMFFDRHIRQIAENRGENFIFSCIDPLLKSAGSVVGNLEGPITRYPSVSVGSKIGTSDNYRFTFPTTTAELLARHNIRVVNVGNNHINDFGTEGAIETQHFLTQAGVNYFGGLIDAEPVYREELKNTPLSFVSYNQFGGRSPELVAHTIAVEHAAGRTVIVFAHWGEEYVDRSAELRSTATLFAENGANIVIGSHPHVTLPHETIGNTPVYYSLGNFIFDQYWEERVTQGLALGLDFINGELAVTEYPVTLKPDGRTCPQN